MINCKPLFHLVLIALLTVTTSACTDDDDNSKKKKTTKFTPQSQPGTCPSSNLSITICDPAGGPFNTTSTNPFFPFAVGNKWVLEGEEDGETVRVEIEVLNETEEVAGVTTRVIKAVEFEDGELIEIARDFYAVAPDGTVCYFGEDVENFEDGELTDTDGSWRAGEDGNLPGIQMPAAPAVGQAYFQEFAPGIAEDMGEIVAFGEKFKTPAGTFKDTMTVLDSNPSEDCEEIEPKGYARNIGNVDDDGKLLISFD